MRTGWLEFMVNWYSMYNHEPENYSCPFCKIAKGIEEGVITKQADVIFRNEYVTAFIASDWWPKNKGHVIIIPNKHYENIYTLPDDSSSRIHILAKYVSLALKETYQCDGTSTRQHNEPAGGQDVWHYHLHVFPRFEGDNLYGANRGTTTHEERLPYAEKLREYFIGISIPGIAE